MKSEGERDGIGETEAMEGEEQKGTLIRGRGEASRMNHWGRMPNNGRAKVWAQHLIKMFFIHSFLNL